MVLPCEGAEGRGCEEEGLHACRMNRAGANPPCTAFLISTSPHTMLSMSSPASQFTLLSPHVSAHALRWHSPLAAHHLPHLYQPAAGKTCLSSHGASLEWLSWTFAAPTWGQSHFQPAWEVPPRSMVLQKVGFFSPEDLASHILSASCCAGSC